jgi:hypothetical protein
MNSMSKRIIPSISDELHIFKGKKEPIDSWCYRFFYSAVGIQMIASLYDDEDKYYSENSVEDMVSMQHVLERGKELLSIFAELYPDILKSDNFAQLSENIREIYKKTGYMLHKNNYLTFPPKAEAIFGTLRIQRGFAPWNIKCVSGLGGYLTNAMKQENNLNTIFHLPEQSAVSWWNNYIKGVRWNIITQIPSNVDFIKLQRKKKDKYWQKKLDKSGIVLYREENAQRPDRIYGLLNFEGDIIKQSFLPSWLTSDGEYARISLALQQINGFQNDVKIIRDGQVSYIRLGYMLPVAERLLLELLTWPDLNDGLHQTFNSRTSINIFNRIISTELLPIFRYIFSNLGFDIKEIDNG